MSINITSLEKTVGEDEEDTLGNFIADPNQKTEDVAIDKIDKIGIDNVNAELREKGLSENSENPVNNSINLCKPEKRAYKHNKLY